MGFNFEGHFTFEENQKGNILVAKEKKIDVLQSSDYIEDSMEVDSSIDDKIEIDANGSIIANGKVAKTDKGSVLSHTSSEQSFHDASVDNVDFNESVIVID